VKRTRQFYGGPFMWGPDPAYDTTAFAQGGGHRIRGLSLGPNNIKESFRLDDLSTVYMPAVLG